MDKECAFLAHNGKCILCGINSQGLIEFQSEEGDILFTVSQAILEGAVKSIGLRTPLFNDQMETYLEIKFNEIKKLLGA